MLALYVLSCPRSPILQMFCAEKHLYVSKLNENRGKRWSRSAVASVMKGRSPQFSLNPNAASADESRCFTVIFHGGGELHLAARTTDELASILGDLDRFIQGTSLVPSAPDRTAAIPHSVESVQQMRVYPLLAHTPSMSGHSTDAEDSMADGMSRVRFSLLPHEVEGEGDEDAPMDEYVTLSSTGETTQVDTPTSVYNAPVSVHSSPLVLQNDVNRSVTTISPESISPTCIDISMQPTPLPASPVAVKKSALRTRSAAPIPVPVSSSSGSSMLPKFPDMTQMTRLGATSTSSQASFRTFDDFKSDVRVYTNRVNNIQEVRVNLTRMLRLIPPDNVALVVLCQNIRKKVSALSIACSCGMCILAELVCLYA